MATVYVYLKNGECFKIEKFETINSKTLDCALIFRGDGDKFQLCVNKELFSHMTIEYKEDAE